MLFPVKLKFLCSIFQSGKRGTEFSNEKFWQKKEISGQFWQNPKTGTSECAIK